MRRLLDFTSLVCDLSGHRPASILAPVHSAAASAGAPGLNLAAPARRFLRRSTSSSRNDDVAFTLRGLHFQAPPHDEAKLAPVARGAAFDVVVDLRRDSPTYRRWIAATLSADNGEALLIPPGCAHGFLTLEDATDALYQIDRLHVPARRAGCATTTRRSPSPGPPRRA